MLAPSLQVLSQAPRPRVAPAIWDTKRPAALLSRVPAGPAEAEPGQSLDAPKAREVLAAVNSVLKDVPAERLEKLTDEQLSGVSELILAQMQGQGGRPDDLAGLQVLAEARLEKLKATPYRRTTLNPSRNPDQEERVQISGLPPEAREVPAEARIYRHYTSKQGLTSILSSRSIWNGFLSHINLTKGVTREMMVDLTGAFFTLPERDAAHEDILANDSPYFVDVRLPKLPFLETQAGKKFLLPLPSRPIAWVKDAYDKWAKGESTPYRSMAEESDRKGGPGPGLAVPVQIVGHGLVGKNGKTYWTDAAAKGLPEIPEAVGAKLDVKAIRAIAAAPRLDIQALFGELKKDPFIAEQLAIPTVAEGYSGEDHAATVLRVLETYFKPRDLLAVLPKGMDRALLRVTLALHDIGKGRAFQQGDLSRQHEHTRRILEITLKNLGYRPAQMRLALGLIDGDPIGPYLAGDSSVKPESPVAEIRRMAKEAGLSDADFFKLLVVFYQADAGSYTSWGGGQTSLDHLFDVNEKARTLRFSSYTQDKIDTLAALLGVKTLTLP